MTRAFDYVGDYFLVLESCGFGGFLFVLMTVSSKKFGKEGGEENME